jgi:hypothetical protein
MTDEAYSEDRITERPADDDETAGSDDSREILSGTDIGGQAGSGRLLGGEEEDLSEDPSPS